MIDSVLNFPSQQAAQNDPVLSAHMDQLHAWKGSYVIPNLLMWRVSQDTTGSRDSDGNLIILHHYLAGWNILISLPTPVSGLVNHPNLQFMVNRDNAIARLPNQIIKANITQAVMQDVRFAPVFMGADYPWGAWQA